LRGCARDSVYAFDFQPEEVDCLDALVDNHWHRRPVPAEQLVETDTEYRVNRRRGAIVRNSSGLPSGGLARWPSRIV
jgi:hypothetical protein